MEGYITKIFQYTGIVTYEDGYSLLYYGNETKKFKDVRLDEELGLIRVIEEVEVDGLTAQIYFYLDETLKMVGLAYTNVIDGFSVLNDFKLISNCQSYYDYTEYDESIEGIKEAIRKQINHRMTHNEANAKTYVKGLYKSTH